MPDMFEASVLGTKLVMGRVEEMKGARLKKAFKPW